MEMQLRVLFLHPMYCILSGFGDGFCPSSEKLVIEVVEIMSHPRSLYYQVWQLDGAVPAIHTTSQGGGAFDYFFGFLMSNSLLELLNQLA
jgi:hypothetical protein